MQTSERINYIKKWILDYCKSMPKEAQTLVVGISGGIDSSVVSTICALTGKKTIVVSMPIKQIKEQQDLSLKHGIWLKKKFKSLLILHFAYWYWIHFMQIPLSYF